MSQPARNPGSASAPAWHSTPGIERADRLQPESAKPKRESRSSTARPRTPRPMTPTRRVEAGRTGISSQTAARCCSR